MAVLIGIYEKNCGPDWIKHDVEEVFVLAHIISMKFAKVHNFKVSE